MGRIKGQKTSVNPKDKVFQIRLSQDTIDQLDYLLQYCKKPDGKFFRGKGDLIRYLIEEHYELEEDYQSWK